MKLQASGYLSVKILFCTVATGADAADQGGQDGAIDYQIVAQKLDQARNGMSPETGSSTYNFDQQALQNLPLGDNSQVSDVLLQAPGVAQDSYGQLHVRGDHGDLQYRINGIILPEGIAGFGQTLDTHFADRIDLLTGALPAEYGYRTAGIVDITTKTAISGTNKEWSGRYSLTAGGNQTFQGNQEFYGSEGPFSYYFTGTYDQNDRGIEPPTASSRATHDYTRQDKEFGYMSYVLNPENRISLIFGNSTNRFQIPNNPGQATQYMLSGTPDFNSADLNERQFEHNTYAIGALQGLIGDKTDYQFALFIRNSMVLYKPDPAGDLIFNGIASRVDQENLTNGLQNDYAYHLNDSHTVRFGWQGSYETAQSDINSLVFSATGPDCTTNPCTPLGIIDNHSKGATLLGAYLQDEWKPADKLTINYGARFDYYDAYVTADQLEPRLSAIYDLTPDTKLHAGYARYFTPPATELIAPVTIAAFQNTTGAPPTGTSSPVRPESDNYYDAGVIQKFGEHLTLGADAYFKQAHHLLDEGQFGQALIFAPFNYDKGYVRGVEFSGDYRNDAFSGYANLALSRAMGKGVESGQYNFGQDELDYIANHWVHLDHDQIVTGSAGAAYTWNTVKYSIDLLYGSGLRSGFANTDHLPFYTQVNAAADHTFDLGKAGPLDARLSVINLFDKVYEIRDGSGIGVFAPQYGPRRTFLVSLSKPF